MSLGNSDTGRVVVGIGHSPGAYQALRWAVGEARRRGTLLIAVRAFWSIAYARGLLGEEPGWATLGEAGSAAASVRLAFTEALGGLPDDVSVEIAARTGTVAPVLVAAAYREADLLVIGGCGARRLSRPRPLAVAAYCLHHAVCPVMVIPPSLLARSGSTNRLARDVAKSADVLVNPDR